MNRDWSRAVQTEFDLIVVGGGCVGTAVAMFGAQGGLTTALLERDDFASGTSGASSEIIHGGLQYLAMLRFHIVRKSNEYAGRIYRSATHLCEPLPLVFACYKGGPIPFNALRVLMRTYDRYNHRYKHAPRSRKLSPSEIIALLPTIHQKGLVGGVLYYEWWMDVPRMCLSNAMLAARHGAVVRNHAAVVAIEKLDDQRMAVTVRDRRTGQEVPIRARVVVNAAGPWVDQVCRLAGIRQSARIRPTKGVHLLVPRLADVGLVLHFVDGRFGLVEPRRHHSLIGTTDDDYYGDLDKLSVTHDDIGYLIEGTQKYLPGVTADDIVDSKVGLRPTIFEYGKTEDKLPRDHRVEDHQDSSLPGLISVYGGKLATSTLMAEDVLQLVSKRLDKSFTPPADYRLPGGPDESVETYIEKVLPEAARQYGLDEPVITAMIRRYGTEYEQVLQLLEGRPELAENLCQCRRDGQPVQYILAAEIYHAVRHEWALTAQDITRRTGLGWGECRENGCLDRADRILRTLTCPTTVSAGGPGGEPRPTVSSLTTGPT